MLSFLVLQSKFRKPGPSHQNGPCTGQGVQWDIQWQQGMEGSPEIQEGSEYRVNSPDPSTRHDSAANDCATIASPNGAGQANKTDFSDCISKVENVSMTFVPARGELRTVLLASLLQSFHKGPCSGQGLIL